MLLKENLDKADASPREGASTDESPRHLEDVVSNFTVEGDAGSTVVFAFESTDVGSALDLPG